MGEPLNAVREVGSTGVEITRIGFGGAPLGFLDRSPSDEDARRLLNAAWETGIRYFDTAPFYGSGLSERRIGDFLREKPRDSYVLSTKVGRLLVPDRDYAMAQYGTPRALPFRPEFDFTHDGVMRSFEQSLQRLGLERIDFLFLHDIGRFGQGERHAESWRQVTEGGGIKALHSLKAQGLVKGVGAGVNEYQVINDLLDVAAFDVFLLANRYTLLDQDVIDTLLPRCQEADVAIVAGAPLSSGILATGPVPGARFDYRPASEAILEKTRRIEAICKRHGTSLIHAALNFPLGHPAITSLIPGFSTLAEFEANLAGYRTAIAPELWIELKSEGLIHPKAPAPQTPILN